MLSQGQKNKAACKGQFIPITAMMAVVGVFVAVASLNLYQIARAELQAQNIADAVALNLTAAEGQTLNHLAMNMEIQNYPPYKWPTWNTPTNVLGSMFIPAVNNQITDYEQPGIPREKSWETSWEKFFYHSGIWPADGTTWSTGWSNGWTNAFLTKTNFGSWTNTQPMTGDYIAYLPPPPLSYAENNTDITANNTALNNYIHSCGGSPEFCSGKAPLTDIFKSNYAANYVFYNTAYLNDYAFTINENLAWDKFSIDQYNSNYFTNQSNMQNILSNGSISELAPGANNGYTLIVWNSDDRTADAVKQASATINNLKQNPSMATTVTTLMNPLKFHIHGIKVQYLVTQSNTCVNGNPFSAVVGSGINCVRTGINAGKNCMCNGTGNLYYRPTLNPSGSADLSNFLLLGAYDPFSGGVIQCNNLDADNPCAIGWPQMFDESRKPVTPMLTATVANQTQHLVGVAVFLVRNLQVPVLGNWTITAKAFAYLVNGSGELAAERPDEQGINRPHFSPTYFVGLGEPNTLQGMH
jgi:hypothetical protein